MQLPTRIDKYLRECTTHSLRALREACVGGRVMVYPQPVDSRGSAGGVTVRDPGTLVYPGETLTLDHQLIRLRTAHDYLMLHKPIGVTTTTHDPDHQEDLSAWLSQMPQGVFAVGRLDRNTSGLLLFTSDGDLAQALLLPTHYVEKRYRLLIDGTIPTRDARLLALERGVLIAGEERPVAARISEITPSDEGVTRLTLRLWQGKHRQIRKMCHAVGLPLLALHRVAVGSLELGALGAGAFRSLDAAQIESLWRDAGGRDWVRQRQLQALQRRALDAAAAGAPLVKLERWLEAASRESS